MIKTVADLLEAIKQKRDEVLHATGITHTTTIGEMYEGLTADLERRTLPCEGLSVVTGFAKDHTGRMSRQLDCMLVVGEGEEVPYTKSRVYLLDQIIAVTEVKKTLYTDKLLEAHENLRSIMDLKPSTGRRIARTVRRAFQDITGSPVPDDPATLPPLQNSLYHLLVIEAGWPLRIVLGYRGFANETTFRKGIVDYLTKILGTHGSGPRSIPGFIIGPNAAAFKNVSMPWGSPIDDDGTWPLLQTNGCLKPAYVLLEAIWTRLSNLGHTDDSVFGEDLEVEEWNRLVDCQIVPDKGWAYNTYPVEVPAYISGGVKEWTPFYVSAAAYAVAKTLFDGWGMLNLDDLQGDPELLRAAEELRRLRIIGPDAGNPRLMGVLLQSPLAARLCDEKYAIGENSSGRMLRWMKKHYPNQRIVLAVP